MQANLNSQSSDLSLDGLEGLLNSEESVHAHDTADSTDQTQDWTLEETAKALGLSRGAIIRRLEDGILPGYKVKRGHTTAWRVKPIWQEQKRINKESIDSAASSEQESCSELGSKASNLDLARLASVSEELTEFKSDPPLSERVEKSEEFQDERIEFQPGLVEVYEADEETENCAAIPLSTYKELIELRTKLALTEKQFQETKEKLENASHKVGYLEARIDLGQEQLKLLTDSKHKQSWWQRIFPFVRG